MEKRGLFSSIVEAGGLTFPNTWKCPSKMSVVGYVIRFRVLYMFTRVPMHKIKGKHL